MCVRTIEEELRKERSREDVECTFQPSLSTDRYSQVKSRFLQVPVTRYTLPITRPHAG